MNSPAHLLSALIDFAFPPQCASCRAPGTGLCESCAPPGASLERRLPTLLVRALGEYRGAYRAAIHALKDGRCDVADILGRRLAAFAGQTDVVVGVPTIGARRRVRGIDGMQRVASAVASTSGCAQLAALRCIGSTPQRGRTREERLTASGRFICPHPLVEGMNIILVDDVCTTGATLEDCAAVLRAAGARVSQAFVVAVANGRA